MRSPVALVIVAILVLVLVGGGAYFIGRSGGHQAAAPTATVPPARLTQALTRKPTTTAPPPTAQRPPSVPTATVQQPSPTNSPAPQPREVLFAPVPTTAPGQPTTTLPAGTYLFRTAAGGLVAHRPPAAAAPLPSTAYSDAQDGFSLSYPSGWPQQSASVQGHQQLTLYPPGSNPTANVPGGVSGISFGWTANPPSISPHDTAYTDLGAVHAGKVRGHLFTIGGPMGYVITATFPHKGGYVVLSADAQSSLLLDAFHQMLTSLQFS